jgi:hypothetical protein
MTARIRIIWWGKAALAVAGLLCFVAAFSYPIYKGLGRIGFVWDWPEFNIRNWVAFHSLHDLHQLPLWNPYECGGMPLLAHPSSQIVTPLFLLPMLFGPFAGLNLQIPAHLAIAWAGGYVLARVLGMGTLGRLTCASIFPASSWFYLHIGVGHLNFLPSAYLPWVTAMVLLGANRRSLMPWACGGLLLAIMFGEGGVYQPTQAAMLVVLIALWLALVRRSLWPLAGLVVMALFALGFGAIKLLPSWELMRLHPRPTEEIDYSPLRVLLTGLFSRHQYFDQERLEAWGFWECGAYLGPGAAALAVLGLASSPRRTIPWMLVAALSFILAIGGLRPWFPWVLLHHLPIFSWERMPERFLILLVFAAGVIAAYGADFLAGVGKPFGAIMAALILVGAVADARMVSDPNISAAVAGELDPLKPVAQFVQSYEDPWSMLTLARNNKGALHCNEELDFHEVSTMKVIASNQPGYRGEHYLLGPGSLVGRRWTPNALSYDVVTPAANVVVINQNYDANWRLARGRGEVFSKDGLLAVRVPASAQHLRLVYRSNAFLLGAAVSLLTCVITLLLWVADRRRGALLENRSSP